MSAKPTGIALLSVYDKTGIVDFARGLAELGWQLYASGGTARAIQEANIAIKDVSELVGGSAILGHRVVTLSREISAGLLADKTSADDMAEMAALKLPVIDLVCVDMYPLEEAITKAGSTKQDVIAQTDIGGPTMLRSAAKGRRIVLSHAEQRQPVLEWLQAGRPDEATFLDELAARAEYEVARYVLTSARYHGGLEVSGSIARVSSPTKYGENPQQTPAAFYADNRVAVDPLGLDQFEHVQGMERSYINMTDIDRLLQTVTHIAAGFQRNFGEVPAIAVGVKHGNACGAAVAESAVKAVQKMLLGDTRAIFGGVIMINNEIDKAVAEALMHYAMEGDRPRLLDGVIGASVTPEALELLSRNKLRVVVNPALANLDETSLDRARRQRPVRGGILEQPNYDFIMDLSADYMQYHGAAEAKNALANATQTAPATATVANAAEAANATTQSTTTTADTLTDQQKRDLILGWAVGSTSNSNTITLIKDGQLIGNGVGQQDRVGAGQLALTRTTSAMPELIEVSSEAEITTANGSETKIATEAKRGAETASQSGSDQLILKITLDKQKLAGATAYSDSFFPFPDGPELLAKAGIRAILTSSGSVGDNQVIATLQKYGVTVAMAPDKTARGFYLH